MSVNILLTLNVQKDHDIKLMDKIAATYNFTLQNLIRRRQKEKIRTLKTLLPSFFPQNEIFHLPDIIESMIN